jgi:hypothetical protein
MVLFDRYRYTCCFKFMTWHSCHSSAFSCSFASYFKLNAVYVILFDALEKAPTNLGDL